MKDLRYWNSNYHHLWYIFIVDGSDSEFPNTSLCYMRKNWYCYKKNEGCPADCYEASICDGYEEEGGVTGEAVCCNCRPQDNACENPPCCEFPPCGDDI